MDESFATMQEEAMRRVREMQQRSQSYVAPPPEAPPAQPTPSPPPQEHKPEGKLSLLDIAGIKIDEEKALIGLLIYILYKNGSDTKLLLGLGYLLL